MPTHQHRVVLITTMMTMLLVVGFTRPAMGQETVSDGDGNVYGTVWIGDQLWMAENLRASTYRNGDPIPHVVGDGAWYDLTVGGGMGWRDDGRL